MHRTNDGIKRFSSPCRPPPIVHYNMVVVVLCDPIGRQYIFNSEATDVQIIITYVQAISMKKYVSARSRSMQSTRSEEKDKHLTRRV